MLCYSNGTDKNTQHANVVKRGFVDRTLIRYRLRIKIREGSPEGIRVRLWVKCGIAECGK